MEEYLRDLATELTRPQVICGLLLFAIASLLLWHAWRGRNTPFPIGVIMPF